MTADAAADGRARGFRRARSRTTPRSSTRARPAATCPTLPDGTIVKVNQTFLAWTGYRRDDLVGRRRFADLLTAGGRIYHETHYAPLLQHAGSGPRDRRRLVRADGSRLPVLVNSVLERDADGDTRRSSAPPSSTRPTAASTSGSCSGPQQRAEESEARARLLARTLQQTLIPPALPDVPGLDVAARYRPAGDGRRGRRRLLRRLRDRPRRLGRRDRRRLRQGRRGGGGDRARPLHHPRPRPCARRRPGDRARRCSTQALLRHADRPLLHGRCAPGCTAERRPDGRDGGLRRPPAAAAGGRRRRGRACSAGPAPCSASSTRRGCTPPPPTWPPATSCVLYTDGVTEARAARRVLRRGAAGRAAGRAARRGRDGGGRADRRRGGRLPGRAAPRRHRAGRAQGAG